MGKKLLLITFFCWVVAGCSNNVTKSPETDEEEIIKTNETVEISCWDRGVPGTRYKYTIDKDNRIIHSNIYHASSVMDVKPTDENSAVEVVDDEVWDKICKVLDTNILVKVDDIEGEYKYYDEVGYLCIIISDLDLVQNGDIKYEKSVHGEEYWDEIYGYCDLNKDGVITYREDFDFNIDVLLEMMD